MEIFINSLTRTRSGTATSRCFNKILMYVTSTWIRSGNAEITKIHPYVHRSKKYVPAVPIAVKPRITLYGKSVPTVLARYCGCLRIDFLSNCAKTSEINARNRVPIDETSVNQVYYHNRSSQSDQASFIPSRPRPASRAVTYSHCAIGMWLVFVWSSRPSIKLMLVLI